MKSPTLLFRLLPVLAGFSLAGAATSPVTFRSFEYRGRDAAFATDLPKDSYRNPILAGFYPDPSICRKGDDYYLVNSTFAYFPGIPIFHSRDLVNWEQLGNVIARPTQLRFDGLGATRGIFAPSLSEHDGTFYLVCTMVDAGGNFLMTATNPAGPWSDPVWLDFDGIDPSLFFDDAGHAWIVNNGNPPDNHALYSGHRAIHLHAFDLPARKVLGPDMIIVNGGADLAQKPVWVEGPHLFQRNGWYYLCCAEGGTSLMHSQVILRSRKIDGPYSPWEHNPILTQRDLDGTVDGAVTCTGHAQLVPGPDGKWWSVFLGCRPFAQHYWTTGRETFLLPVTWTSDGWPQILPQGVRVPLIAPAPVPPGFIADRTQPPLTGNFTWTDTFSAQDLGPSWLMLRAPAERWWNTGSAGLRIEPRAPDLSERGNPSFLGHRVQHARFDCTVELVPSQDPKVLAGLAAFQNEEHFLVAGVRQVQTPQPRLSLEWILRNGGENRRQVATIANASRVELRLRADDRKLVASYRTDGGEWHDLSPVLDTVALSVQAAGDGLHFTGAVVGPCAFLTR